MRFPRQITSNSLLRWSGLTTCRDRHQLFALQLFSGAYRGGSLRTIETDPPLPVVTYVVMFREMRQQPCLYNFGYGAHQLRLHPPDPVGMTAPFCGFLLRSADQRPCRV